MPGWERSFAAGSGVGISVPAGTQPRHRAGGETWLGAEELSSTFWLHDPIEIPFWAAAPAVSVPEAAVGTQGGVSILARASV